MLLEGKPAGTKSAVGNNNSVVGIAAVIGSVKAKGGHDGSRIIAALAEGSKL